MIKAIIFDFDGVLVDSVDIKTAAFARLFEDRGEEVVKKVIEYHLAHGGVSRYEKFKYYYREVLKEKLTDGRLKELGDLFNKLVIEEVIRAPLMPGAKEFLDKYHASLLFFIVSGTPESEITEIVEKRGMGKYFKGVYGSPATKERLLKKILEEYAFRPDEVVFIGDAITDFEGARSAGIEFVAYAQDPSLSPLNKTGLYLMRSIMELEERLAIK